MLPESLPSPGIGKRGHELRSVSALAISQVQVAAAYYPSGKHPEAGALSAFFEACRTAAAALSSGTATPVPTPTPTPGVSPLSTWQGSAVAFGDSVSAGTGATQAGNSWIKRFAAAQGLAFTNMAVSGWGLEDEFTQSGKITNDYIVTNGTGANKKDNAVLVIGGNDVFTSDTNGNISATKYAAQLRQRLAVLRLAGYAPENIMLGSLYPVPDSGLASQGVNRTTWETWNAVIAPAAIEYGVCFADLYSINGGVPNSGETTGDNIHPNDAGHQRLADTVASVTTILNKRARPAALAATAPAGGQLVATFTAAAGSPIGYTVEYAPSSTYVYGNARPASGTTATFNGLAPGDYRVRVRAEFADGAGPWEFLAAPVTVSAILAPPSAPPEDWRMVASGVTTSTGAAGSQTALADAQATTASKSRPSFTVASGATEWIEWAIPASSTPVLLSFVGTPYGGATVAVDGADAGYADHFPTFGNDPASDYIGTGTTKTGRRQHILLPASSAARAVRLTVIAGASARTVYPLLHKLPASGPRDCHVSIGASREDQGMPSRFIEDAIIAAFPARDPVVFAWGKSSAGADDIEGFATQVASIYGNVASYGTVGASITNSWTLPYSSAQQAGLASKQAAIVASLKSGGLIVGVGNLSFRITNNTTPLAQGNGSKPFNDNIIHPEIQADAAYAFDASYGRARIDEYLFTMRYRGLLADDRHGSASQYDVLAAYWADQWYRYVYTGSWGTPFIEQLVAAAESTATNKATAFFNYTEAAYARDAIATSSGKAAIADRLAAIYPTAQFFEAVRLIDVAVASPGDATKAAAQTALNAAASAGYSGGTAPNTVAAQQARIDALVSVGYGPIAQVALGSATPISGWNRTADTAALGTPIADLAQPNGSSTGWALVVTNAGTAVNANTALTSQMADFPSATLSAVAPDSSNQLELAVSGLNDTKKYDVLATAARTGVASRLTKLTLNGTVVGEIDVANNVSNQWTVLNVSPVNGTITLNFARGTGASTCYASAFIIKERA